jgi:rod shape determining protein RodA
MKVIVILLALVLALVSVPSIKFFTNNVLGDYQRQRIETFFSPEEDLQGSGWQVNQSKIAIGSGRLWGRGFLQGTQSKLRFLPFAHTDFIFAALGEQFGLLGATFVLLLFTLLIGRVIALASRFTSLFGKITAVGVATMILLHVFINVGMNLGQLPVTGIPLPLVSYGGSSVLVNLIALGIVQSIAASENPVDRKDDLMVVSDTPWRK